MVLKVGGHGRDFRLRLHDKLADRDDGDCHWSQVFDYEIENFLQSHIDDSAVGELVFEILFFHFPP